VGVGVYKAGQHQLAADIDLLLRRTRQALAHGSDATVAHGDIQNAVEALRRIDDPATPKQKIVWRGLDIHDGPLVSPRCIVLVRRHRDKSRDRRHAVCMLSWQSRRTS
jgi:hypothetical protein